MEREQQLLEEYKMLKSELLYFMNKDSTLFTCLFSVVTAILFFSLEREMPEGCLLAYLVIIPVCSKQAYHQKQMAKMATYMSLVLEKQLELKWETYVKELSKQKDRSKQGRFLKFSECSMMAVAATISYLYLAVKNHFWIKNQRLFEMETALILVLFVIVIVTSRKIYCIKDYRKNYESKIENINL